MTSGCHAKLSRAQMTWRAAQDIEDGSFVNLGIGIPEMVASYVPAGRRVTYHTENGILGFGGRPPEGHEDLDLGNAGKKPVTMLPGTSFFHHADSFAMIRGGHIDLAIMGAFQVSAAGDLANWRAGDDGVPAVGGAMDLVSGGRIVRIITEHVTRDGQSKLLDQCTYPLTGVAVVSRVYTDLAVIDVEEGGFVLREMVARLDVETLQELTGSKLHVRGTIGVISASTHWQRLAHSDRDARASVDFGHDDLIPSCEFISDKPDAC
jgi:3-oxoadipate CoA-transferase beta subunit